MGQLILAEMLFEFPIFGPAALPFHGAHEGNKGHGSKGQDVVPAILLDHAAKLGSTNLQIIRVRCDNSRAAGVRLGRSFRPIRFVLLILLL
jgi:hypothetical protein